MGRGRASGKWQETETQPEAAPRCVLCGRSIPSHARSSRHHLKPKLKGGGQGETVLLHQVCHATIHAHFSETELARRLTEPEALRREPVLAAFIEWVRDKPDDFHVRTHGVT